MDYKNVELRVPSSIKERIKKLIKKDKTGNIKNIVMPKYSLYLKWMIYNQVIDHDTAIDLLDTFVSSMRMLKMNEKTEEKGFGFIITLVFNYIQKIEDDLLIKYVNEDDFDSLYNGIIDAIESNWDRKTYGKTARYWFMTFLPIIAGFIEPAYLTYAIWIFKPHIYYSVDKVKLFSMFNKLNDKIKEEYGILDEWVILPRDFIKPEKLK